MPKPSPRPTRPISLGCACADLRRATRAVTQLYDAALRPEGLRATQFTLLQALDRAGPVTQGVLADITATDSTTLSRTLSLLEDEGFVRQTGAEGGRKAYEVTDAGSEALERNRPAVDAVFARLDEAAQSSPRSSPRVERAMQNLGVALRLRLQGERPTDEQIDAIAAAIDEAAAKIERV